MSASVRVAGSWGHRSWRRGCPPLPPPAGRGSSPRWISAQLGRAAWGAVQPAGLAVDLDMKSCSSGGGARTAPAAR